MLLCDATSTSTYELLDETSTQRLTNKQLPEVTVTSMHELPDKTVPLVTGNNQLPEATHASMQVLSDKTISSVPMNNQQPDVTNRQLPDVTVVQVIQDEAENSDRMEFEATIEYPVNDTNNKCNKEANERLEQSESNNTDTLTNIETNDSAQKPDQHLLDNSVSLDLTNSENCASNLKTCIIKLTDLSAEERNKWLGLTEKGSVSNSSTDSNNSRYYMRSRTDPPRNNKRPGRKITKHVNYHESPPSRELNDSDYEPNAKCGKPLDNKQYLSDTRIAIQKVIDENKIANQGQNSVHDVVSGQVVLEVNGATTAANNALPEAMDVTIPDGEKPIATSSPKAKRNKPNKITKDVPDATLSPETRDKELLPGETPKSSDVVSGNTNSVDVASENPKTHDGMNDIPGKDTESNPKDSNDVTPSKLKKESLKQG